MLLISNQARDRLAFPHENKFQSGKKNPNTLCTSVPQCLLSFASLSFSTQGFLQVIKKMELQSGKDTWFCNVCRHTEGYALEILPSQNYNELVIYLRREKKQTEQEQHRNVGLFGRFYFIFFQYSPQPQRQEHVCSWERGKNSKSSSLYVCTCGKIHWTYVTMKSGGQSSALLWRRRKMCSCIPFHLLFTSIKPSWFESTRLSNFGVEVCRFTAKGFTPVPMQETLHSLMNFA